MELRGNGLYERNRRNVRLITFRCDDNGAVGACHLPDSFARYLHRRPNL